MEEIGQTPVEGLALNQEDQVFAFHLDEKRERLEVAVRGCAEGRAEHCLTALIFPDTKGGLISKTAQGLPRDPAF